MRLPKKKVAISDYSSDLSPFCLYPPIAIAIRNTSTRLIRNLEVIGRLASVWIYYLDFRIIPVCGIENRLEEVYYLRRDEAVAEILLLEPFRGCKKKSHPGRSKDRFSG